MKGDTTSPEIPLVDMSVYGMAVEDTSKVSPEDVQVVADDIINALSTMGFCYLKNHGVAMDKVNKTMEVSKQFFDQPLSEKEQFARQSDSFHGYVKAGLEKLNLERPVADFKEHYNYTPAAGISIWTDKVPEFQPRMESLFAECTELAYRLFELISRGLHLQDKNNLKNYHKNIGKKGNLATLRTLMYPAVSPGQGLIPGQAQCGEHSDYGTLTMLFQDDVGGLQVKNSQGVYIDAVPIEGTILINIGDMLQQMTSDKLHATEHRVVMSEETLQKRKPRQSLAYFTILDDEAVCHCLDGSNKYESVKSLDWVTKRFMATY